MSWTVAEGRDGDTGLSALLKRPDRLLGPASVLFSRRRGKVAGAGNSPPSGKSNVYLLTGSERLDADRSGRAV